MKAAVRRKYCRPDQLAIEEIDIPKIGSDEILIKIHCTTVNRTDCAVLTGKPFVMRFFTGLFQPTRIITGTDMAGEVMEVGTQVKSYKAGDKVFAFRDEGLATHAQYVVLTEKDNIGHMHESLSYEQAAASLEGVHYAINFTNKVQLKKDQTAAIIGATGAIGTVMIQLLKYYGLKVTAIGHTKNQEMMKELGADKTYDYTVKNFLDDRENYDYIFDTVGKASFKNCKKRLKEKGIFISTELGPNNENPLLAIKGKLYGSKKVIFPIPVNIKKSMTFITKMISEGKFRAIIDRRYPLAEISDAFLYVEKGFKTGNVIINMWE